MFRQKIEEKMWPCFITSRHINDIDWLVASNGQQKKSRYNHFFR